MTGSRPFVPASLPFTDPVGQDLILYATARDGIAAEVAVLDHCVQTGAGGVLLWQARERGIVIPAAMGRREGYDDAARASAAEGWPVALRPSGGGAVPQGPGVINLAMVWHADDDFMLETAYETLCAPMIAVLADFDLQAQTSDTPGSFCDGAYNLAIGGRKIVGTAQRWRVCRAGGRAILGHAMIMVAMPPAPAVQAIARLHHGLGVDVPLRVDVHAALTDFAPTMTALGFAQRLAPCALRAVAGTVA